MIFIFQRNTTWCCGSFTHFFYILKYQIIISLFFILGKMPQKCNESKPMGIFKPWMCIALIKGNGDLSFLAQSGFCSIWTFFLNHEHDRWLYDAKLNANILFNMDLFIVYHLFHTNMKLPHVQCCTISSIQRRSPLLIRFWKKKVMAEIL